MSNIGKTGVDSIRLGGRAVDELPIAEAAITKQQLPGVFEADRQNRVTNIKAKYPKQTVAWIDGAISECNDTIKNIRGLKGSQQKMIDDYTGFISLCKHRDKELKILTDPKEIAQLKRKFPPYNVKAMRRQIKQCKEAIERADGVVDKEHASISELNELRVQCVKRDEELKALK